MWLPRTLETREATLDFTSSDQGRPTVRQFLADDILVGNHVDETGWSADSFQPLVCEACGIEHCEPGNWMVLRRAGRFAVFLPDFSSMLDDIVEYAPPPYLRSEGAMALGQAAFQRLRDLVPGVPEFERLFGLRGEAARRLLQFEAVCRMLGEFPEEVAVRRDRVVACSDGELSQRLEQLSAALGAMEADHPVRLRPMAGGARKVVFFLDDPRASAWAPMAIEDARPVLLAAPGLVVEPI